MPTGLRSAVGRFRCSATRPGSGRQRLDLRYPSLRRSSRAPPIPSASPGPGASPGAGGARLRAARAHLKPSVPPFPILASMRDVSPCFVFSCVPGIYAYASCAVCLVHMCLSARLCACLCAYAPVRLCA
jgi:hypothetical protein